MTMIRIGKSLILLVLMATFGCTSPPESLKDNDLIGINSIDSLIDNVIGYRRKEVEYRSYLTFPSDKDILEPALYVRNYCDYLNGELTVTPLKLPYLEQINMQFDSDDNGYVFEQILASFGRYQCSYNDTKFTVDITHNGSRYSDESARYTTVNIYTVANSQLAKEIAELDSDKYEIALQEKLKFERNAKVLAEAKIVFNVGQAQPKEVGQKICSVDNRFGYVEKISGNKIKILFVGKVGDHQDYFLFENLNRFTAKPAKQSLIWDDSYLWSGCEFNEIL